MPPPPPPKSGGPGEGRVPAVAPEEPVIAEGNDAYLGTVSDPLPLPRTPYLV